MNGVMNFAFPVYNARLIALTIYNRTEPRRKHMKIVVLDGHTLNPGDLSWSGFQALGDFAVHDRTPSGLVVERIGDAEIVLTNKTVLSDSVFASCPSLRYVGVLATGYNVVDVVSARSRGIAVTNIPTYGTTAVAQYVFALLLEICHHVGAHHVSVQAGEWTRSPDFCYWKHPLIELAGKTLGIVGFGRIGQATARIALALGMEVLAVDEIRNPSLEAKFLRYATFDEMLGQADVISLHCPLLPSTQGLVNRGTIARMKDGVILLNTSRGPLINEADLREALESGKVAAAAVDVVSSEPIRSDNPLLGAPNCLITPHIAWAPKESRTRLMTIAIENLEAYLSDRPQNLVGAG
jgi:glycerate dehydrogenase